MAAAFDVWPAGVAAQLADASFSVFAVVRQTETLRGGAVVRADTLQNHLLSES